MQNGKKKHHAATGQTCHICCKVSNHTTKFGISAVPLASARTGRVPERTIGQTALFIEKRNDTHGRGEAGAAAFLQKHERSLRAFWFVISPAGIKVTPDENLMGENHD